MACKAACPENASRFSRSHLHRNSSLRGDMSPERPQVHHTGVHPEQAPARSEIDEIDSPLRGSHRHSIDDRTFYDDYDKSSKTEWRLRMHQFGCNVHGRDLPHEELGRRRWPTISTYLDRGQAGFSLGNRLLILIRRHRKDGTGPHMCDDQLSSDNVKIIMTRIASMWPDQCLRCATCSLWYSDLTRRWKICAGAGRSW